MGQKRGDMSLYDNRKGMMVKLAEDLIELAEFKGEDDWKILISSGNINISVTDIGCPNCGCQYRAFKDKETLEKYKLLMVQIRLDRALGIKNDLSCNIKGEG
jgi:hypothetical protein